MLREASAAGAPYPVPSDKVGEVLDYFHKSKTNHGGFEKIQPLVRRLFAIPNEEIKDYLLGCYPCRMVNQSTTKVGLSKPMSSPSRVNERWHMDFIQGLPKYQGRGNVLVIVDQLSRYVRAYLVNKISVEEVTGALRPAFRGGAPRVLGVKGVQKVVRQKSINNCAMNMKHTCFFYVNKDYLICIYCNIFRFTIFFIMATLAEKQFRANIIVDFYCAHNYDKALTWNHFKVQKFPRSTVYRVISDYDKSNSSKFKQITGRPTTKLTKSVISKIDKQLEENPEISVRQLANKFKISPSSAQIAKKRIGYKSYVQQPAPKLVKNQSERIIKGATKIYKQLIPSGGSKIIVMDDETYM